MVDSMPPPSADEAQEAFAAEEYYFERNGDVLRRAPDFHWADGFAGDLTLNVKHTLAVPKGSLPIRLIVPPPVEWCDIYVLIRGRDPNFKIIGWAWGIDIKQRWDTSLPYPAYSMDADWLFVGDPMDEYRVMAARGIRPKGPPHLAAAGG